eukprot:1919226-Rhodomonas_salina.1
MPLTWKVGGRTRRVPAAATAARSKWNLRQKATTSLRSWTRQARIYPSYTYTFCTLLFPYRNPTHVNTTSCVLSNVLCTASDPLAFANSLCLVLCCFCSLHLLSLMCHPGLPSIPAQASSIVEAAGGKEFRYSRIFLGGEVRVAEMQLA